MSSAISIQRPSIKTNPQFTGVVGPVIAGSGLIVGIWALIQDNAICKLLGGGLLVGGTLTAITYNFKGKEANSDSQPLPEQQRLETSAPAPVITTKLNLPPQVSGKDVDLSDLPQQRVAEEEALPPPRKKKDTDHMLKLKPSPTQREVVIKPPSREALHLETMHDQGDPTEDDFRPSKPRRSRPVEKNYPRVAPVISPEVRELNSLYTDIKFLRRDGCRGYISERAPQTLDRVYLLEEGKTITVVEPELSEEELEDKLQMKIEELRKMNIDIEETIPGATNVLVSKSELKFKIICDKSGELQRLKELVEARIKGTSLKPEAQTQLILKTIFAVVREEFPPKNDCAHSKLIKMYGNRNDLTLDELLKKKLTDYRIRAITCAAVFDKFIEEALRWNEDPSQLPYEILNIRVCTNYVPRDGYNTYCVVNDPANKKESLVLDPTHDYFGPIRSPDAPWRYSAPDETNCGVTAIRKHQINILREKVESINGSDPDVVRAWLRCLLACLNGTNEIEEEAISTIKEYCSNPGFVDLLPEFIKDKDVVPNDNAREVLEKAVTEMVLDD